MTDRNSEEQINKDIEFISDIIDYIEDGDTMSAMDHLDDWKDELKLLLKE